MPVRRTPGLYKLTMRLTGLDISAPQVGPVALEILDLGVPRAGLAENCRVDNAKLACKG